MIKRLALAAALIAAPASAQTTPYKLVVTFGAQGIAVTDYPSRDRCEKARAEVEENTRAERAARKPYRDGTDVVIPPPWVMTAFCIPG